MIGSEPVMVAGCDEVGRGPLAGDVVAAALPFYRVQFIAYLMHDL